MDPGNLDWEQFGRARDAALARLKELKAKYPGLQAEVVISSVRGEVAIDASVESIGRTFPAALMDGEEKETVLRIVRARPPQKVSWVIVAEWLKELMAAAVHLRFDGSIQVELRFLVLDYELVEKLQVDPLVDGARTPRSRASIRIVLGTLAEFSVGAHQGIAG